MNKTELLEAYERTDKAEALGLSVELNGFLALAVIEKRYIVELLEKVTGSIDTSKQGTKQLRYNMTKGHTSEILKKATRVYNLPFKVQDIEKAYHQEFKRLGKRPDGGRGTIFEELTRKALNGTKNAKQNQSRTESGDSIINGLDIQIKYDRGGFTLLK